MGFVGDVCIEHGHLKRVPWHGQLGLSNLSAASIPKNYGWCAMISLYLTWSLILLAD